MSRMREILSNTNIRRLELIEYLYYSKDWVSLDFLTDQLDCVPKTLKMDFLELDSQFHFLSFESFENNIRIHFKENYGIETIYKIILEESPGFQLVEILLLQSQIDKEDLMDKLFMSNSSIYRLLNTMNNRLRENYNIGLSFSPIKFIGNEVNIRFFISQFISEKYSFHEWPYKGIEEEKWNDFLRFFVNFSGVSTDFTRLNYLKVLSLVSLIRYKNGFRIIDERCFNIDALWEKLIDDPKFKSEKTNLQKIVGVEITKPLLINLFYPYLQKEFAFSYEHLLELSKDNQEINKSVLAVENMLFQLSKEFQLNILNTFDLTLELHNLYYLQNMEIDSNYILFNKKKLFCKTIEQRFPELIHSMKKEINQWLMIYPRTLSLSFKEHILYALFTYWESLVTQLLRREGNISVLIITKFDIWQAKMLADYLNHYFSNQIKISIYNQLTVDLVSLESTDYDIILGTFRIPNIKGKVVLNISNIPTNQDLEKIYHTIRQLNMIPERMDFDLNHFI